MPSYSWLIKQELDTSHTELKINAMRTLGVPYALGYEKIANQDLQKQEQIISQDLAANHIRVKPNQEVIALIAYLQRLGTDIKNYKKTGK